MKVGDHVRFCGKKTWTTHRIVDMTTDPRLVQIESLKDAQDLRTVAREAVEVLESLEHRAERIVLGWEKYRPICSVDDETPRMFQVVRVWLKSGEGKIGLSINGAEPMEGIYMFPGGTEEWAFDFNQVALAARKLTIVAFAWTWDFTVETAFSWMEKDSENVNVKRSARSSMRLMT